MDQHVLDIRLGNVNYEALRSRLKTTNRRTKNKSRRLQDAENHLTDWWNELLEAEQALQAKLANIEATNQPSYLHKNHMEEMNTAADGSVLSRHRWVDDRSHLLLACYCNLPLLLSFFQVDPLNIQISCLFSENSAHNSTQFPICIL